MNFIGSVRTNMLEYLTFVPKLVHWPGTKSYQWEVIFDETEGDNFNVCLQENKIYYRGSQDCVLQRKYGSFCAGSPVVAQGDWPNKPRSVQLLLCANLSIYLVAIVFPLDILVPVPKRLTFYAHL
jgi:hypothetical protein